MATDDTATQTAIVELHGRNIVIKLPNSAQLGLMAQQARIAAGDDPTRKMRAIGIIMDIVQNLIAATDQDYVIDLMIAGKLDVNEVMALFDAFKEETRARPAAVRRARR